MHALVVRAAIHNADRTREVLKDRDDVTLDGVEVREVVASA
jgi:hypothetical protein